MSIIPKFSLLIINCCILCFVDTALADSITKPYTFESGTNASAAEVNANFDTLFNQVNKIGSLITTDPVNSRVGILNGSPAYTLDVKGSLQFVDDTTNQFMLRTIQRNQAYSGGNAHDRKVFQFRTFYQDSTGEDTIWSFFLASPEVSAIESPYLYAFENHNFRIGTIDNGSRRAEIEIYNAGGGASGGALLFRTGAWQDSSNTPYVSTNVRMLIDNVGNVGIGTMAPDRLLKVNGDAGGITAWYNDSDERLKKNISNIKHPLEKVEQLQGVQFEWKDTENRPDGKQIGFIAQETIDIVPEVIDKKGEYYSMQYAPLTALLVEAIKELKAENDSLKNENDDLRAAFCMEFPQKAICQ